MISWDCLVPADFAGAAELCVVAPGLCGLGADLRGAAFVAGLRLGLGERLTVGELGGTGVGELRFMGFSCADSGTGGSNALVQQQLKSNDE